MAGSGWKVIISINSHSQRYRVIKKEGEKVEGYRTAKKWTLRAVQGFKFLNPICLWGKNNTRLTLHLGAELKYLQY